MKKHIIIDPKLIPFEIAQYIIAHAARKPIVPKTTGNIIAVIKC